jgi:hypothetical protein
MDILSFVHLLNASGFVEFLTFFLLIGFSQPDDFPDSSGACPIHGQ